MKAKKRVWTLLLSFCVLGPLLAVATDTSDAARTHWERQAFLSKFHAVQGEGVLTLDTDYFRAGDNDSLGKSDGTHVIIDGQGHSIQGMILSEGTYTFRNCKILPIPVDDSRPHEYSIPGLTIDYMGGPVSLTLEDTVTLVTGPDSGCAPIEIPFFSYPGEDRPSLPMQVTLHTDALAEGDGVAIAYQKADSVAAELHLSGSSTFQYAFCWGNEDAFHYTGTAAAPGELPFLRLAAGVTAVTEPERVTIPALAPLQLKDEGPVPEDPMAYHTRKYLLPFTLHSPSSR